MTDNQYQLMDCIATNFNNKNFYFADLKEYGTFYPATLTSLVNLGFIDKKPDKRGKYVYSYVEPCLTQEEQEKNKQIMELEFQVNQAKGLLDHLERSKVSWITQIEEMGLEFPLQDYDIWFNKVYKQAEEFLYQKQSQLLSIITSSSAF